MTKDEILKQQYYDAAMSSLSSGFSRIAGSYIDYAALKTDASQLMTQASNVELVAAQRANLLRENFIGALGNYKMSAAQRGVSVTSGSVVSNIASSSEDIGRDIQKGDTEAKMQANALRTQADIAKIRGKNKFVTGMLGAAGSFAGAYKSYQTGSKIGK